jgi:hypothetical protein
MHLDNTLTWLSWPYKLYHLGILAIACVQREVSMFAHPPFALASQITSCCRH